MYCQVELGQLPSVVDVIAVPHDDQLGVVITALPQLCGCLSLHGQTHLCNGNEFEECVSIVHPHTILGVQHADTVVLKGIILELVNVESQDVCQVIWSAHVLAGPCDQPVGHHEQHLVLSKAGNLENSPGVLR